MALSGPSVTEAYRFGWSELTKRFLELFLIGVVWLLLSAPSGYFHEGIVGLAYHVFVLGPVGFGGMYAFLRAARGETPEVSDLFAVFQRNYLQAVLASVLMSALIGIGAMLLVVPGIIAAVRLAWVPYIVVEEGLDAVPAIRASWERTRGYSWTIFGIWLLAIPIFLVGLLLLVVGAIPALMWIQLASACLYAAVSTRDRLAREAAVEPPAPA